MKFNVQGLLSAGLQLVAPFGVDIQLAPVLEPVALADGREKDALTERAMCLEFEEVLRVLPGRRVSGKARLAHPEPARDSNTAYFAKVFFGTQCRRYWQRELRGARYLQDAGVPHAAVAHAGATADQQGYVILYTWLEDAGTLNMEDPEQLGQAVDIFAQLHSFDLLQTDVHVDNFQFSQGTLYAVDADGIRPGRLLRQQFPNLALFLAERPPLADADVVQIWQRYAERRGEYVQKMGSGAELQQLLVQQRQKRVGRYLRKTQRQCTEFEHRRTFSRNFLCAREHWKDLQHFMVFPDQYMQAEDHKSPVRQVLKRGNSATVVRVEIAKRHYVIKRYNLKSLTHRIRRWFKPRARAAWCNGQQLAFLEIPTAKPVALLELKTGWFRGVCYLVMPDVGKHNLLDDLPDAESTRIQLVEETVQLLQQLDAAQLCHGDLKASNFVFDENGHVSLVDYDGLVSGPLKGDIERFRRNWREHELAAHWDAALHAAGLL